MSNERREQQRARAAFLLEHGVDDLLHGLSLDHAAAVRAVRCPDACEQQPQVVVDFGDGRDRRTRVAGDALLVDGDGGREPIDVVDVGLLHQPEELPRVRGERLDITSLPLGVDGVEGQRRLAGAAEPGNHNQAVARDRDRHVFQVVFACAGDNDSVGGHVNLSRWGERRRHAASREASGGTHGTSISRGLNVYGIRRQVAPQWSGSGRDDARPAGDGREGRSVGRGHRWSDRFASRRRFPAARGRSTS